MIFKIIVATYCIVNLILNLIVLPRHNKGIREDNERIMDTYAKLDRLIDKLNKEG